MKTKYQVGDQVVIVTGQFEPKTLEVIDIDGHRTEMGGIVPRYLLSNSRHYLEVDLFASRTDAKTHYTQYFELMLTKFD